MPVKTLESSGEEELFCPGKADRAEREWDEVRQTGQKKIIIRKTRERGPLLAPAGIICTFFLENLPMNFFKPINIFIYILIFKVLPTYSRVVSGEWTQSVQLLTDTTLRGPYNMSHTLLYNL